MHGSNYRKCPLQPCVFGFFIMLGLDLSRPSFSQIESRGERDRQSFAHTRADAAAAANFGIAAFAVVFATQAESLMAGRPIRESRWWYKWWWLCCWKGERRREGFANLCFARAFLQGKWLDQRERGAKKRKTK